jgi:radical SAM superfamily enzyme YgiQ (UPF0313 family)
MVRRELGDRIEPLLVEDGVEETIRAWQPQLLAISSVSQNYKLAMAYAREGRRAGIPVIVGGYHITELPASLTPDMDACVIGEGERAICELVELLLEHGSLPPQAGRRRGIVYWDGGERVVTGPREVIGKSAGSSTAADAGPLDDAVAPLQHAHLARVPVQLHLLRLDQVLAEHPLLLARYDRR